MRWVLIQEMSSELWEPQTFSFFTYLLYYFCLCWVLAVAHWSSWAYLPLRHPGSKSWPGPRSLHWKVGSQTLDHQGSPREPQTLIVGREHACLSIQRKRLSIIQGCSPCKCSWKDGPQQTAVSVSTCKIWDTHGDLTPKISWVWGRGDGWGLSPLDSV